MKSFNQDICHHRLSFTLDNRIRKWFQNPVKIVQEYIKPGDTVVDIGCGPGFFTIEMARMVGEKGRVIAVDLQPEMLTKVARKAQKNGLARRIELHNCAKNSLNMTQTGSADFILAYYMIHETPDPDQLLGEVKPLLKKGGKFLIVEPKFHVSEALFQKMIRSAQANGFTLADFPHNKGGRSVLLSA